MKTTKQSLSFLLLCGFLSVTVLMISCSKGGGKGDGPSISNITPNSVLTGAYITISGNKLDASNVVIGGIAAQVTTNTNTSIETKIPQGLTAGVHQVVVTNAEGSASGNITVTGAGAPPVIISSSPDDVARGAVLTITGTGLTDAVVEIATKVATVNTNTATSITVTVPTNIAAGAAALRVTTSLGTVVTSITVK